MEEECMDFEEKFNPWSVSSLEDFRFYCCPECDCKNVTKDSFVNHAVIAHPHSKSLIDSLNEIKTETKECENNNENTIVTLCYTSDDTSDSDTDNESSQPTTSTEVDLEPPELERNDFLQPRIKKGNEILPPTLEQNEIPSTIDHDYSIPVWDLDNNIVISSICSLSNEETVLDSYTCNICFKQEPSQRELKYHILSNHTESKNYPFTCDKCDKRFKQKENLRRHMQSVHEGVRHICKLCSQTYSRYSDLKKHVRVKHGGSEYKCDICHKSYIEKHKLINHMKVHGRYFDKTANAFIVITNNTDALKIPNENIVEVSMTTKPKMNPFVLLKRCDT